MRTCRRIQDTIMSQYGSPSCTTGTVRGGYSDGETDIGEGSAELDGDFSRSAAQIPEQNNRRGEGSNCFSLHVLMYTYAMHSSA